MSEISRRNFLTGAALVGAAAGVAGLAGCSSPSNASSNAGAAGGADGAAVDYPTDGSVRVTYAWEVAPEPITEFAAEVDTDILIIGAGLAGNATACAAAEQGTGKKITVVEKTESWVGRGGGFGAIKSKYMDEQGIVVDKVNGKQHWIAQCASRANEDLITRFFNDSETASNWLL